MYMYMYRETCRLGAEYVVFPTRFSQGRCGEIVEVAGLLVSPCWQGLKCMPLVCIWYLP